MPKRFFRSLLYLLLTSTTVFAHSQRGFRLSIVESNNSYIICDVQFDSVAVVQRQIKSKWYSDISMEQCAFTDKEGLPRLPVTSLVLGIPPVGIPKLTILSENSESKSLGDITPADPQIIGDDSDKSETLFPKVIPTDWYPAKAAQLGTFGFMRDQRILQVELHPVRFHPRDKMTRITKSMRLRIDLINTSGNKDLQLSLPDKSAAKNVENLYRKQVDNYSQAKGWRRSAKATVSLAKTESAAAPYRYKLQVREDGIYTVTGKELEQAGADLGTIVPSTLTLTNHGQVVPIIVEGAGDGVFYKDDRIIFIGEHNGGNGTFYSYYSDTNIYWLTWGNGVGARFVEIPGVADSTNPDTISSIQNTIHLEKDKKYERLLTMSQEDRDHWFWQKLTIGDQFRIRIPAKEIVQDSPMHIRVGLQGLTHQTANPDHKVVVSMNDQDFGEAIWDNQNPFEFDSGIQTAQNIGNDNFITLNVPGGQENVTVDQVWLNWIEVECQQKLIAQNDSIAFTARPSQNGIYKITGFTDDKIYILTKGGYRITAVQPLRDNAGYTLVFANRLQRESSYVIASDKALKSVERIIQDKPSDLHNPANGADYIIISHANFLQEANKLADYRSTQNLRTQVIDVQDIYDEFNDGIYDPAAIRRFLKYAYENWVKPSPLYVLLFGDTTNMMDKTAAHEANLKTFVPTMMEYTYSWGMTASDNYFVTVQGEDFLPDMFVGRLPANTAEEADIMVQKVIDYETNSVKDAWRRNVCLLSGNNNFFETSAQYLVDHLIPKRFVSNRVSTELKSHYFGSTTDVAHYLNSGQAVLNFIGHGGGGVYFDSELFLTEDVSLLNNRNKYPIAFSMTCFIGHFDNPEYPSLAEELLRAKDKGIVAHFGSAGRAYLYGDFFLNNALFDALFHENARRIGEVTTMGKLGMVQETRGYWDQVKNYILLGDPAMICDFPKDDIQLHLSKTILKDGDQLIVSGQVQNQSEGNITVSAFNNYDSLLVQKEVPLQSGVFSIDLFSLDSAFAKAWKEGSGNGIVRAYFENENTDGASSISFSVKRPSAPHIYTIPEKPSHLDSTFFIVQIDSADYATLGGIASVNVSWSTNTVSWENLNLQKQANGLWKSLIPVSKPEGTKIFYKVKITASDSSATESEMKELRVIYRPDLFIEPSSINITGTSHTVLSATLQNGGDTDAGAFSLTLYEGTDPDNGTQISPKLFLSGLKARSDTTISIPWNKATTGAHDIFLKVDEGNQISESNETNNMTQKKLWIITIKSGTGGTITDDSGSYAIAIPAEGITQNTAISLEKKSTALFLKAAASSSLTPIKLAGTSDWNACEIRFSDSTVTTTKPVSVVLHYDKNDSTTRLLLTRDALRIFAWNAASNTWNGFESTINPQEASISAQLPAQYLIFALFGSSDAEAPHIKIGVEGQNFADGDNVSPHPTMTIMIEDESGFDFARTPFTVALDDNKIEASELAVFHNKDSKNQAVITFAPQLKVGEHHLQIEATDINGNMASTKVEFTVAGKFVLASIANHPNPFARQTTIAFNLTDIAEQVKLGIYTVSGRLIRSFTFTDISGYVEQEWDGLDEDGNDIANGVYYLKFSARNGDKKIECIEKMAKLQ